MSFSFASRGNCQKAFSPCSSPARSAAGVKYNADHPIGRVADRLESILRQANVGVRLLHTLVQPEVDSLRLLRIEGEGDVDRFGASGDGSASVYHRIRPRAIFA